MSSERRKAAAEETVELLPLAAEGQMFLASPNYRGATASPRLNP